MEYKMGLTRTSTIQKTSSLALKVAALRITGAPVTQLEKGFKKRFLI